MPRYLELSPLNTVSFPSALDGTVNYFQAQVMKIRFPKACPEMFQTLAQHQMLYKA